MTLDYADSDAVGPFKCEHPGCGKTFAISSSLTIHMVSSPCLVASIVVNGDV